MAGPETRVVWSWAAKVSLIEAVRAHPSLWDPQNEKFKLKGFRRDLFASVASALNLLYPQLGTFTTGKL